MYYSPVRHSSIAARVRLACIRHAASVHPEPGSNSLIFLFVHLSMFLFSSIPVLFYSFELTFFSSVQFSKISLFFLPLVSFFRRALIYNIIILSLCQYIFFFFFIFFFVRILNLKYIDATP